MCDHSHPDDRRVDDCPVRCAECASGGALDAEALARLAQLGAATPLGDGAVALHELYLSFLSVGFPEDRAFQLVSAFLFHALETGGP